MNFGKHGKIEIPCFFFFNEAKEFGKVIIGLQQLGKFEGRNDRKNGGCFL